MPGRAEAVCQGDLRMNVFTVDVEEWFNTQTLASVIAYEEWDRCESRIERQMTTLLELLQRHRTEATFFVLGWIAERYPELVRTIASAGHEIASHGYRHLLLTSMTREEFRLDLDRALLVTQSATGLPVEGYRAPAFTVTQNTLWALGELRERGLKYDASIAPVGFHPEYGIRSAPLGVHRRDDGLIELPMSCARIAGCTFPASGGGYFRQLPYALSRFLFDRCNRQGRPVIFYCHPWELDPGIPRVRAPLYQRIRHYHNLETTLPKLEQLLHDYTFTSVRGMIGCNQQKERCFHDRFLFRGAGCSENLSAHDNADES